MCDAPHKHGSHLDERGREDVGNHKRPRAVHCLRAAENEVQLAGEVVDASILRGNAQRLAVDVESHDLSNTQPECGC